LKPSGIYYLEVKAGSGSLAASHDTVFIKYTEQFLDGTVLDSNVGTNDTLKRVLDEGYPVAGLDDGIKYMRLGGKAIFLIPSKLAYGTKGYYPYIAGYTPFLFDVELVKLKAGTVK
jgi:FKBP-type peptidyl-prolyl cis-trans isomerase FkpA